MTTKKNFIFLLKWNILPIKDIILSIGKISFLHVRPRSIYLTFFLIFFKRQKCLLPFTEVGQRASTNKAGLNFDIPRNNVLIVRKVTYLLRKSG